MRCLVSCLATYWLEVVVCVCRGWGRDGGWKYSSLPGTLIISHPPSSRPGWQLWGLRSYCGSLCGWGTSGVRLAKTLGNSLRLLQSRKAVCARKSWATRYLLIFGGQGWQRLSKFASPGFRKAKTTLTKRSSFFYSQRWGRKSRLGNREASSRFLNSSLPHASVMRQIMRPCSYPLPLWQEPLGLLSSPT